MIALPMAIVSSSRTRPPLPYEPDSDLSGQPVCLSLDDPFVVCRKRQLGSRCSPSRSPTLPDTPLIRSGSAQALNHHLQRFVSIKQKRASERAVTQTGIAPPQSSGGEASSARCNAHADQDHRCSVTLSVNKTEREHDLSEHLSASARATSGIEKEEQ